MRRNGLTLIEILAVVMILGLMSAIGLPVLVRWAGVAQSQEWFPRLRAAERTARLASYGKGGVIVLRHDGIDQRDPVSGLPREALRMPSGFRVNWEQRGGGVQDHLSYDHLGRSDDLVITVESEGRRFTATLSGLTGEWSVLQMTSDGAR